MVFISVPATSANLGPGFDCLGVALGLYARFTASTLKEGVRITGCAPEDAGGDNLVYRAYAHTLAARSLPPAGLCLHIHSDIPPARGLGSSAACIVGGILIASALHGLNLEPAEVFQLATDLEGHPDNAAPAVFGGLRVSVLEGGQAHSLPAALHPTLKFLALVPDFPSKTREARAVLPALVPLSDAVYNLSRSAFLLKALEAGDPALLRLGCGDRLHQDLRLAHIKGGAELKALAENLGAAACFLSGAGPALMCLYTNPDFPDALAAALREGFPRFTALSLAVDTRGATVERMNP